MVHLPCEASPCVRDTSVQGDNASSSSSGREVSSSAYHDSQIQLQDGRILSYLECGALEGQPVLFFHPLQANRWRGGEIK